jgi:hypothetical protein
MALTNKQKAISAINKEGSFNTGEKRSLRNALDYTFNEISSSGGGFDPLLFTFTVTPGDGTAMTVRLLYDNVPTGAEFNVEDLISTDANNSIVDGSDGGLFYDDGA